MAVLLGTLLGIPFWLLGLFRIIRISGYWRAVNYVRRGRVLIVANHPSLIETFLIPLVFWPWAMFRLRMFPWSLPDKNLFKGFTPEHHERLRCIRVGRDDTLESRKLNWVRDEKGDGAFRETAVLRRTSRRRSDEQTSRARVGRTEQDGQDQERPDPQGRLEKGRLDHAAARQDDGCHEAGSAGIRRVSAAPAPQSKMLADQTRVSPSLQDRRTEVRRRNRKETSGIGDSHTRDA